MYIFASINGDVVDNGDDDEEEKSSNPKENSKYFIFSGFRALSNLKI